MFSARTLTSSEARVVAEAFLKAGRNPNKVGQLLGMEDFNKELLAHPLVRREVISLARMNAQTYSMVDHMEKLAQIRDEALDAGKFSAALGAELAVGRAAGLYDKGGHEDPNDPDVEPTKLSSQQIREILASRGAISQPQEALPSPETIDYTGDDERISDEEDDRDDFFRNADPPDDGLP